MKNHDEISEHDKVSMNVSRIIFSSLASLVDRRLKGSRLKRSSSTTLKAPLGSFVRLCVKCEVQINARFHGDGAVR